ncbi:hypothetical protein BHM03_00055273 [Ensete ventricosum]|nr:hypothetical protein BHM03_00055273 [Ensete ventricosum]
MTIITSFKHKGGVEASFPRLRRRRLRSRGSVPVRMACGVSSGRGAPQPHWRKLASLICSRRNHNCLPPHLHSSRGVYIDPAGPLKGPQYPLHSISEEQQKPSAKSCVAIRGIEWATENSGCCWIGGLEKIPDYNTTISLEKDDLCIAVCGSCEPDEEEVGKSNSLGRPNEQRHRRTPQVDEWCPRTHGRTRWCGVTVICVSLRVARSCASIKTPGFLDYLRTFKSHDGGSPRMPAATYQRPTARRPPRRPQPHAGDRAGRSHTLATAQAATACCRPCRPQPHRRRRRQKK